MPVHIRIDQAPAAVSLSLGLTTVRVALDWLPPELTGLFGQFAHDFDQIRLTLEANARNVRHDDVAILNSKPNPEIRQTLAEDDIEAGSLVQAADAKSVVPIEIRLFCPAARQGQESEALWSLERSAEE